MNDPDRPYMPAQTAAQQKGQQPQSGPPSTTGGAGYGTERVALPQAPGHHFEQAGSKSLEILVQKFVDSVSGPQGLGSNEAQAALMELRMAAKQADEEFKQLGIGQYPATPPGASKPFPGSQPQQTKK